jgi:Flp pilus assembly protein TadD
LEQCADDNSERQVSLCTVAIESNSIKDAQRSQAYDNRGVAYAREERHERALADFNEAIRLAPDNAVAFANRGNLSPQGRAIRPRDR